MAKQVGPVRPRPSGTSHASSMYISSFTICFVHQCVFVSCVLFQVFATAHPTLRIERMLANFYAKLIASSAAPSRH